MSLLIENPEHLRKVLDFAERRKLVPKLLDQLWYLHTYAARAEQTPDKPPSYEIDGAFPPAAWRAHGVGTTTKLFSDFAPASFYFIIEKAGKTWFNGGLIYHGNQAGWILPNGQTVPEGACVATFSVELAPPDGDHWSVHT